MEPGSYRKIIKSIVTQGPADFAGPFFFCYFYAILMQFSCNFKKPKSGMMETVKGRPKPCQG